MFDSDSTWTRRDRGPEGTHSGEAAAQVFAGRGGGGEGGHGLPRAAGGAKPGPKMGVAQN